jgi:hypothetical protein
MRRLIFFAFMTAAPVLVLDAAPASACGWYGYRGCGCYGPRAYGYSYYRPAYAYRPAYFYRSYYRPAFAYGGFYRPRVWGWRRWGGGRRW